VEGIFLNKNPLCSQEGEKHDKKKNGGRKSIASSVTKQWT